MNIPFILIRSLLQQKLFCAPEVVPLFTKPNGFALLLVIVGEAPLTAFIKSQRANEVDDLHLVKQRDKFH